MKAARVELYIDTGDAVQNEQIFDQLFSQREAVEEKFGGPLHWERLEGRRASRIHHPIEIGGLNDVERWPEIQEAMIDAMVRLHTAFAPTISQVQSANH